VARYIAFLRAINVGGHVVTMERLRALFAGMGYPDAETFIASGNVIFETRAKDIAAVEKRVSRELEAALGYAVGTFVRSDAEVAAVSVATPFPERDMREAVAFNVGFMSAPLGKAALTKMRSYNTDMDLFTSVGREFYWMSRTRQSESPFFKLRFEKAFEADVTFRSMTTIRKLAAKYPPRA
jgi:uncharacterized protein (DUF1697 family)